MIGVHRRCRAELGIHGLRSWGREKSRKVRETRSSSSQKRSEPAAHPCRGPGGQGGNEHGGSPSFKGGVEPGRAPAGEGRKPVAGRVRRACDDAPLSVPVRLCDAPYLLAPGKRGLPATFPWHLFSRPTPFAVGRKLSSFSCSIPPLFVLSHNMPMINITSNWLRFGAFLRGPAESTRRCADSTSRLHGDGYGCHAHAQSEHGEPWRCTIGGAVSLA